MAPFSNEFIKQLGQGPEKLWRPMGHLTKYLQSQCFGLSLPSAIAATEDVKKKHAALVDGHPSMKHIPQELGLEKFHL